MTKEERIQEGYGKYWNKAQYLVDESGWILMSISITRDICIDFERQVRIHDKNTSGYPTVCVRPKSLQGIENNNGWIKIESDDDLPKEEDDYHICIENKDLSIAYFDKYDGWFIACPKITHYQPIIKPELPIY